MIRHPVPDLHLKWIGDITVSFALLESTIQSLIGSMIREHQRVGQIITAQLSFKNLRALLISLYIERHGEDEDYRSIRNLVNRAGTIEDRRNQIMHSVWAVGNNEDTITRFKTTAREKSGWKFQVEEVSADSLEDFAAEIRALASELQRFLLKLVDEGKAFNNPGRKLWP